MNNPNEVPQYVPIIFVVFVIFFVVMIATLSSIRWDWHALPKDIKRRINLVAARCKQIERHYGWISDNYIDFFKYKGGKIRSCYRWDEDNAAEFLNAAESFLSKQIERCDANFAKRARQIQQLADFDKKFALKNDEPVAALPSEQTYTLRPRRELWGLVLSIASIVLAIVALVAWKISV